MTNPRLKKAIALMSSLSIVLLGALFIISAVFIAFQGGTMPYTRERVSKLLLPLIPSAVITVLLVIFGFVLSYLHKDGDKCDRSRRTPIERLKDFSRRFEGIELPEPERTLILNERSKRRLVNIFFFSFSAFIGLSALIYVIFLANFTVAELNNNILVAFAVALPLFAASVGVHIIRLHLLSQSSENEFAFLKECIKRGVKPLPPTSPKEYKHESRAVLVAKLVVLAASVTFVIVGIINGGMEDVLGKAVKICTECIGLG